MNLLFKFFFYGGLTAFVLFFANRYYFNGPLCESGAIMHDKVAIVTGGNTGIGKETVKDLARRGAKVYLCTRSIERGHAALDDIRREIGIANSKRVIVSGMDLASTSSIRKFVKDFLKKEKRLDVLINNAGVMNVPQGKTVDGFETTFGVNHLGHFLLTALLTDILVTSAPSRVVTVSSLALEWGKMHWDDIMLERGYSGFTAYCQSKLANYYFNQELSRRLQPHGVTTYALHPGAIKTELQRHSLTNDMKGYLWFAFESVTMPFWKDIPHGAATQICCAVDEKLGGETGKFYKDLQEYTAWNSAAHDNEAGNRLWRMSLRLLQLDRKTLHASLR